MKLLVTTLAVLGSMSSFAALSPYYDMVRQFKTVIDSTEVAKEIKEPFKSIHDLGGDKFEVVTEHCKATVVLNRHVPHHPGGVSYSVHAVRHVKCTGK